MRRLFWLLLFTLPALAQEPNCPKLTWQDLSDHSEIWVENPYAVESALSFEFTELTNVKPDQSGPLLIQVHPHQKFRLFSLTPLDRSQRYRYNWRCHWMWGDLQARPDGTVYHLPYAGTHKVLQGFNNATYTHNGELAYAVDFDLAEGTSVLAARDGVVVLTEDRFTQGGWDKAFWLTANYVMVCHSDEYIASYDHLQPGGVKVAVGQAVKAGDLLGLSGNTGYTAMPHLHFMVFRARDGYQRESFPVKFQAPGHPEGVAPVEGGSY